jgi:hypothetical protein
MPVAMCEFASTVRAPRDLSCCPALCRAGGSIEHRHSSSTPCSTPGALAPVRVILSRSINTYSAPSSKAAGAGEDQLRPVLKPQRKAQWRMDFVAAENSMGFRASQELARQARPAQPVKPPPRTLRPRHRQARRQAQCNRKHRPRAILIVNGKLTAQWQVSSIGSDHDRVFAWVNHPSSTRVAFPVTQLLNRERQRDAHRRAHEPS